MAQVWANSPYRGERLLVHLALADFANDEGVCWPSQRTLAHKARCSENFVRVVLKRMVADGFIEIQASTNGRGNTNHYRLKPHSVNGDSGKPHSREAETPFTDTDDTSLKNRNEPSITDDAFEQFWKAYPRKVAKPAALKAFRKVMKKPSAPKLADLIESVKAYASTITDLQFCPYPATYLNQERWTDTEERKPTTIEVPQHIKDAQSIGAAHRLTGQSETELRQAVAHLAQDAQEAALNFYWRRF